MKDKACHQFQSTVTSFLVHHRSILDAMSKFQEASAHVNRAIVKAVTTCGCVEIKANKQSIPDNTTLPEISKYVQTHLKGKLCTPCLETIEAELGTALFYLTAICSLLNLDLNKIITQENDRISTLGVYSLT